jgi:hypothetical protein
MDTSPTVAYCADCSDPAAVSDTAKAVAELIRSGAPGIAILLESCAEIIGRQQLMIEQAKLMPRVEFQQSRRKH